MGDKSSKARRSQQSWRYFHFLAIEWQTTKRDLRVRLRWWSLGATYLPSKPHRGQENVNDDVQVTKQNNYASAKKTVAQSLHGDSLLGEAPWFKPIPTDTKVRALRVSTWISRCRTISSGVTARANPSTYIALQRTAAGWSWNAGQDLNGTRRRNHSLKRSLESWLMHLYHHTFIALKRDAGTQFRWGSHVPKIHRKNLGMILSRSRKQ